MEPLHITEADAVRDLAAILQRVQAGAEFVIERDAQPLAVIRAATPARRTISECIALMPADFTATIDSDFAKECRGGYRLPSGTSGAAGLGLMLDSTAAVAAGSKPW